jgi:arabinofuranosyltransferase
MSVHSRNIRLYLILVFLIIYVVIVLRNAWICDDAYITLRTIDNFVNGYGLTFNVIERVQTYTHPLWLFVLTIPYAIFENAYFTPLIISILLSLAAVSWYAFKLNESTIVACLGIITLTLSDAFVDYSTSGLENPLTYFLLVLFLSVFLKRELNLKSFFYLSFIACLAALNRMDSVLLFLPSLAYAFWKIRSRRAFMLLLFGFTPLVVWELFSLLYYGSFFPNTAYAKLNIGLDSSVMFSQGLYYLYNSVLVDPLTVLVILCGIVIPFVIRDKKAIPISIGLVVTHLYIIWIGGCFMSGRHLAVPMLCSVVMLSQYRPLQSKKVQSIVLVVILIVGLTSSYSPVYTTSGDDNDKGQAYFKNDIVDERAWYHLTNGLLNFNGNIDSWPNHELVSKGKEIHARGMERTIAGLGMIGMVGYYAGPKYFISDAFALADPFLSKLPIRKDRKHKPGHYRRAYPPGYIQTVKMDRNLIIDENLSALYDRVRFITRGHLFSHNRIMEILKFNLGAYDDLVKAYLTPHLIKVPLEYISTPRREGKSWRALRCLQFNEGGLQIELGRIYHSPRVEISRHHLNDLRAVYLLNGELVTGQIIPKKIIPEGGLSVSILQVPQEAVEKGYDMIRIYPEAGDGRYSLGHIRLIEDN